MKRLSSTKAVVLAGRTRHTRITTTSRTMKIAQGKAVGRTMVTGRRRSESVRSTTGERERAQPHAYEWGSIPSQMEEAAAEERNLRLQARRRHIVLTGALSRQGVADLVGVSPQAVSEMAADGRLVGLKHGREWRFPLWQFTPDAAEPVLPALDRLAAAFPGGVGSLARWMSVSNSNFDGQTPARVMGADPERVIAEAGALTAAG